MSCFLTVPRPTLEPLKARWINREDAVSKVSRFVRLPGVASPFSAPCRSRSCGGEFFGDPPKSPDIALTIFAFLLSRGGVVVWAVLVVVFGGESRWRFTRLMGGKISGHSSTFSSSLCIFVNYYVLEGQNRHEGLTAARIVGLTERMCSPPSSGSCLLPSWE